MKKHLPKIVIVLLVIGLIIGIKKAGLEQYLTLDYLKESGDNLIQLYHRYGAIALLGYMLIYTLVAALSIPGAAIMTLAGGAIFGRFLGTFAVSIASTTGATMACLIARYLLRDWVEKQFGDKLKSINDGIEKEGAFYLFTLRLVPAFPFFLINLAMGLTKIPLTTFFFISMIGMLPGTFVFVNAGTELAKIDSLSGILSPKLIFAFVLLGILPLILKKVVQFARKDKETHHGV